MAYTTTAGRSELGFVTAIYTAGSAAYKYRGAISKLFGGDLHADRATVERWYNSMPSWAKQVLTMDDMMSTEGESRGAGSIVDYAKRMDAQPMVKGGWTQADMTRYENAIAENFRVAAGSGQHDWHILLGTLQAAVVNIALYGNPLGPPQPELPPPPDRPGLPLPGGGQRGQERQPGGQRTPPGETDTKPQEAGMGTIQKIVIGGLVVGAVLAVATGKVKL